MTLPERIPTEIVQLFASAEAWNYRLVPYDRRDGIVLCAGEQGRDYASASQEIEVLSGFRVQIEPVGPDELSLLLNRYYRREETRPISGRTADLSRIGSGQGFLTDLIGEAFDEYASDIHFEPYEERCRIRLRIDGKLIENDDRPVRRSRAGKFGFGFTQPAIVTVIVAVQQVNDRIAASRIGIVSFGKNHQILDLLVHRRAVHANGVHPLSASRNPAHKKRCHPHDPKPERNVSTKAFAIFHVSCCQSPAKIANRKINESTRPIKSCMSYGKRVESPYRIKAMSANGPPRTRTAIKTQKSAPIGADFLSKGESHFRFFVHV